MSIPGISSGGGSMSLEGGDAKSGNGDFIGSAGDKYFNFGGSDMPGWMMEFARSNRGSNAPVMAGLDVRGLLLLGAVGLSVYLLAKRG